MAFRIAAARTFRETVEIGDQSFGAVFNALSDEDLAAFNGADPETQKAFLRRATHLLDDLLDDDDAPLAYTPARLEELIRFGDVRVAMMLAYNRGFWAAKAGN